MSTCNFLKVYFHFAYFLALSPFRFKKCAKTGNHVIHSWWPQKLLCAAAQTLSVFWVMSIFRRLFEGQNKWSPNYFLNFLFLIFTVLLKLSVLKSFWTSASTYLNIVHFAQHQNHDAKNTRINVALATALSALMTSSVIRNSWTGAGLITYESKLPNETCWISYNCWWNTIISNGKYNFDFVIRNIGNGGNAKFPSTGERSPLDTLVGILAVLGYISVQSSTPYCTLLMLMTVLTLWLPARQFIRKLKDVPPYIQIMHEMSRFQQKSQKKQQFTLGYVYWRDIKKEYDSLRHLAGLVNKAVTMNVLLFLLERVLFFATKLDQNFIEQQGHNLTLVTQVMMMTSLVISCTVMLLAADVPHKMKALSDWLYIDENRVDIPIDQLSMMVNDINGDGVSIKAGNIFSVTYYILANILGATLGYFIICLED